MSPCFYKFVENQLCNNKEQLTGSNQLQPTSTFEHQLRSFFRMSHHKMPSDVLKEPVGNQIFYQRHNIATNLDLVIFKELKIYIYFN